MFAHCPYSPSQTGEKWETGGKELCRKADQETIQKVKRKRTGMTTKGQVPCLTGRSEHLKGAQGNFNSLQRSCARVDFDAEQRSLVTVSALV